MTACSDPAFPGPEELKTSCVRDDRQLPSSEQCDQASRPNSFLPQGLCTLCLECSHPVLLGSLSQLSQALLCCPIFGGLPPMRRATAHRSSRSFPPSALFFLFTSLLTTCNCLLSGPLTGSFHKGQSSVLGAEPGHTSQRPPEATPRAIALLAPGPTRPSGGGSGPETAVWRGGPGPAAGREAVWKEQALSQRGGTCLSSAAVGPESRCSGL